MRSGSFVYDVDLGMEWTPRKVRLVILFYTYEDFISHIFVHYWIYSQYSQEELKVISHNMVKLSMKFAPFERLTVSTNLAQEIFKHNEYKSAQIPRIAEADDSE